MIPRNSYSIIKKQVAYGGYALKKNGELVSGKLKYNDVEFTFVFDGKELRLIPPQEESCQTESDLITISHIMQDPLKIDVPFLKGICYENGHHYIFLTQIGELIGSKNAILFINVLGYIKGRSSIDKICKMSFSSPELNCIYPVNQVLEYNCNRKKLSETGVFSIRTSDFASTTTEKKAFIVDEKKVMVYFGISRGFSTKVNKPPVSINSSMSFTFDPTSDYKFIMRLWRIAKEFICFLCYRKNVTWPKTNISIPFEDGKTIQIRNLYITGEHQEEELETLEKGRFIKRQYIESCEELILSDLAQNLLYTRHIPDSYNSGRYINASRFIMITAAFEWEFHRRYPNGVPKKESTVQLEMQAEEEIQKLISTSSGKLKKKFQFLKKLIKSDSLQTEIIKLGEDFDSIIGEFGHYLYEINNEKLNYNEMGKRIADQRNHFAHGDLDKDFIGTSLLDLMYMEYIVYALQLKKYDVANDDIRKAINDLFGLEFNL